jgi:hypothetical protein
LISSRSGIDLIRHIPEYAAEANGREAGTLAEKDGEYVSSAERRPPPK